MRLVFFAGSARDDSFNKKLARAAYAHAQSKGADATFIDLAAYSMPLYDGDLEAESGVPANAQALKSVFKAADGMFIASPEYNSGFSPLLKNIIDWCSRSEGIDDPMLSAFNGKVVCMGAVSPGALGGMRGLVMLRMLLGNIGMHVIPQQVTVKNAFDAFDENGALTDDMADLTLKLGVDALLDATKRLKS